MHDAPSPRDTLTSVDVIDVYLRGLSAAADGLSRACIAEAVDMILATGHAGRRIYLFGNGGSAATASHMANDLNKQCVVPGARRFRAITLNDNVPTMMAWANDKDYGDVLVEQLTNHLEPDDLLIVISTSGTSPNVVRGVDFARERGARVIAFTGPMGGDLPGRADCCVHVPSPDIGHQEDLHLVLNHVIGTAVRARLGGG